MFVSGQPSSFVGTYYEPSANAWNNTPEGIGVGKFLTPHTPLITPSEVGSPISMQYKSTNNPAYAAGTYQPTLPSTGARAPDNNVWGQGQQARFWTANSAHFLAFANHSTWLESNTGFNNWGHAIRCVTDDVPNWYKFNPGDDAHIIYLAADGSLQLGQWGNQITNINQIVLFQFGSLIGCSDPGWYDAWSPDGSDIVFNPTTRANYDLAAVWSIDFSLTTIPSYQTSHGLGNAMKASYLNCPATSDVAYHNWSNIVAGKGDPCRVAGLTADQVRTAGSVDELDALQFAATGGLWRQPTAKENAMFCGGPQAATWKYGDDEYDFERTTYNYYQRPGMINSSMTSPLGASLPILNTPYASQYAFFLPSPGHRNGIGTSEHQGAGAAYLSAQVPKDTSNFITGYTLGINDDNVFPMNYFTTALISSTFPIALPVRCVPQ